MCNINILLRNDLSKSIKGFMQSATAHSFIINDDGEGIFLSADNTTHKSFNKINYTSLKGLDESKTIISHQRYATSGIGIKNIHPFVNKDFVMVHNGVINHFKEDDKSEDISDSHAFFNVFNKEFNKLNTQHNNRQKSIKQAINKLFKEDKGSYSIFILDRKTELSYYFKDSYTDIHFYKSKNFLFITTESDNKLFLSMLNEKFIEYDIKARVVYKIKGIKAYSLLELPKSSYREIKTYDYSSSSESTTQHNTTQDISKKEKEIYSTSETKTPTYCDRCQALIIGSVYLDRNKLLCERCIDKEIEVEKEIRTYNNMREYAR